MVVCLWACHDVTTHSFSAAQQQRIATEVAQAEQACAQQPQPEVATTPKQEQQQLERARDDARHESTAPAATTTTAGGGGTEPETEKLPQTRITIKHLRCFYICETCQKHSNCLIVLV